MHLSNLLSSLFLSVALSASIGIHPFSQSKAELSIASAPPTTNFRRQGDP
jgi:hypothetical protein